VDKPIIYIGLDVHKDTVAVAVAVAVAEGGKRGEVRQHGKVANTTAAVTALAVKLARGWQGVAVLLRGGPLRLWYGNVWRVRQVPPRLSNRSAC
jgi:transposase